MSAAPRSPRTTRAGIPGLPGVPVGYGVGAAALILLGALVGGFFGALWTVIALILAQLVMQVGALSRLIARRLERDQRRGGGDRSGTSADDVADGAAPFDGALDDANPDGVETAATELARIAGLLEDLRDMQRRLDDRLVAVAERASATVPFAQPGAASDLADTSPASGPAGSAAMMIERALNRLLALGFEQIEVITPREEVAAVGGLVVEARRGGAVHKGTVKFDGDVIADVEMRPAHDLFP